MDKNGIKNQGNRIVVIGLDSADFYLVQKWVNEGRLPAMASLMARGSWGKLNSTADIGSATVWPSFFTGTSPAKHCVLGTRRLRSGTYRVIYEPYPSQLKIEPFWLHLSRAGKRIAIIDVPVTYPIEGLNGVQLVAWGAHSPRWHTDSWPRELMKEVKSRFGSYPAPDDDEFIPKGFHQLKDFYDALVSGIERKGLVSRYFSDQEAWDFFLTVFAETHCVGHNYWHLMDENHPAYDPGIAKTLGDSILNVYSSIDSEIARLIDVSPDATFLIFSPEGMGPNYTGSYLLPEILRKLVMGEDSNETISGGILSKALNNPVNKLRRLSPAGRWGPHAIRNIVSLLPLDLLKVIERLKRMVPKTIWHKWKARLMTLGNDWRWSRAFCLPSDFNGAIRINLKGREPEGGVEPGAEYESLCNELVQELGSLINIDTGKKAVSEVLRVDQVYKGEYLDELPDIVVNWAGDAPIRGLYSPRIGTITGENRHERTGAHRPYGFLIAAGKHIAQGRILEGADIMDIAPTILYLMGGPVPSNIDGKVLLDILEDQFKANNSLCY